MPKFGEKRDCHSLYSLAHLTLIGVSPPELVYIAARAGYDAVSPRFIPMHVPGEFTQSPVEKSQIQATKTALKSTGLRVLDVELARLTEDVDPTTLVDANGASSAIEGLTYAGTNNYEGPCPPGGNEHTYHFALYALSENQPTMTRLDALTRSEFEEAYSGNILGQANLTGTFSD